MRSASALIVEPLVSDAIFLVDAIAPLGFHVTVAATFHEAVERLRLRPGLLIADIRLGEYNGLHLVLRGKAARRDLPAIVTSAAADAVLQSEAEQLGATFVVKPIGVDDLRAAICRTVLRAPGSLEGPIRPPFERRSTDRRQGSRPFLHPNRRLDSRRGDVVAAIRRAVAS